MAVISQSFSLRDHGEAERRAGAGKATVAKRRSGSSAVPPPKAGEAPERPPLFVGYGGSTASGGVIPKSHGVTLTELIIVVACLSILAGLGGTLFLKVTQFYQLTSAKTRIQNDARVALDLINRELRQAVATTVIIDRYPASTDTTNPPCSRIQFLKAATTAYYNIFYQKGRDLVTVDTATRTVASGVRSLFFSYPQTSDTSLIGVSLSFEAYTYSRQTKVLHMSVEKVRLMN